MSIKDNFRISSISVNCERESCCCKRDSSLPAVPG